VQWIILGWLATFLGVMVFFAWQARLERPAALLHLGSPAARAASSSPL